MNKKLFIFQLLLGFVIHLLFILLLKLITNYDFISYILGGLSFSIYQVISFRLEEKFK